MYRRQIVCLIGVSILLVWVSVTLAGTVSDEARRYMARGMAAVEMARSPGDYALAVPEFEQAARLAPDWPEIYYNLGLVQSKIGDYTSAMKSFQRYLDLAPQSPDAAKVRDEIFKLEYRRDRDKMATMLAGTWTASNGHKFKLLLDGSRLQLTREENQGDDILNLKSMGQTHTGPMTDAPPLVFSGIMVGDKISGQYMQAAGKSSGHCNLPERKGNFEGTIDIAAGQIRIVYNRVTLEYKMEFTSFFSAELVCRQTDRQETPGYVLDLKKQLLPGNAPVPGLHTGIYEGTRAYKNGDKYVGEFVNGNLNGKGTYTCSNGKQFTGNFENNNPVGFTINCN